MKAVISRRLRVASLPLMLAGIVLPLPLGAVPSMDFYNIDVTRSGAVLSRATIPGKDNHPTLIKIRTTRTNGKVTTTEVADYGEVTPGGTGKYDDSYVIAANDYFAVYDRYDRWKTEFPELALRAENVPVTESLQGGVRKRELKLSGVATAIPAPDYARYAVVKGVQDRSGDPANWVAMWIPFDFSESRFEKEPPPPQVPISSLLYSRTGQRLDVGTGTGIGADETGNYSYETFTYRDGYYGKPGDYQQSKTAREADDTIFGPVAGVKVSFLSVDRPTDDQGRFAILNRWPCMSSSDPVFNLYLSVLNGTQDVDLWAELNIQSFNPEMGESTPYYLRHQDGFSCENIGSHVKQVDLYVNVLWLTGKIRFVNLAGQPIPVVANQPGQQDGTLYEASSQAGTSGTQSDFDFDADGVADTAVRATKVTREENGNSYVVPEASATGEWQAVYFSSGTHSPNASTFAKQVPDLWRVIDQRLPAGSLDTAILTRISKQAVANTDIYLFRESTGELMLAIRGLKDNSQSDGTSRILDDGSYAWDTLLRNPADLAGAQTSSLTDDRTDAAFANTNKQIGFSSRYQDRQTDVPRPGEMLQVVAINRTTGYVGTARFALSQVKAGDSDTSDLATITQKVPEIIMAPPNLKVWATRENRNTRGLDTEPVTFLIGSEGAARPDDRIISLYTEWLDREGRPLPEALGKQNGFDYGLTGRLSMLADGKLVTAQHYGSPLGVAVGDEDAPVIDRAVQFSIGPGRRLQMLRLSGSLAQPTHFYVQVLGRSMAQEADHSRCNPCEYNKIGANPTLLERRPNHFTPIYTPRYDEAATLKAQRERNAAGGDLAVTPVEPVYRWSLRPEYQFSLVDLEVRELEVRNSEQQWRSLLADEQAKITSGDDLVRLLYRLILSDEPLLPGFDTPNSGSVGTRQWVFALGEEEVYLTATSSGQVLVDSLDHLFKLDTADFLTAKIYLNNDPENLLWQFAYGTVLVAVDRNRNGCLEFSSKTREQGPYLHCAHIQRKNEFGQDEDVEDMTTPDKPFRFWVNDDFDVVRNAGSTVWAPTRTNCEGTSNRPSRQTPMSGEEGFASINADLEQKCEQTDEHVADLSNTSPGALSLIETERDLEDFFPMAVRLPDDMDGEYVLKWTAQDVQVNVFRADWRDTGEGGSAYDYLRVLSNARAQVDLSNREGGHVMALTGNTVTLDAAQWRRLQGTDGVARFLVEGVSPCLRPAGDCRLTVALYKRQDDGEMLQIGESVVYLDLRRVEDFMDYWNAGMVASESGTSFAPGLPGDVQPIRQQNISILEGVASASALEDDYVLLVHGWRMKEQEKQDFAHTAFKRLYWSGYQGKFGFLTWPTGWFEKPDHEYDVVDLFFAVIRNLGNYNDSESVAHGVGLKLADKMPSLKPASGRLHVIAHSMGNVVVSEALRNVSQGTVTSYVASQAAESSGAYDPAARPIQHKRLGYEHDGVQWAGDAPDQTTPFVDSWLYYHGEFLLGGSPTDADRQYLAPPDLYRDGAAGVDGRPKASLGMNAYPDPRFASDDRNYYRGIGVSRGVRMVNAHNRGDAALRAWELNQLFKPGFDFPFQNENAGDWDYRNEYTIARDRRWACLEDAEAAGSPVANPADVFACEAEFAQSVQQIVAAGGVMTEFVNDNRQVVDWIVGASSDSSVLRNVEILAHAVPSRTHALGQMRGTRGELSPDDGDPFEIDLRTYDNGNQGHSGQFYASLAERKDYWEESLGKGAFPNELQRPVSCLAGWVRSDPRSAQDCGRP